MISRFTTILLLVIILSFVLLGGALIFFEYESFVKQLDEYRSEVALEQRHILRREVERTIGYLENRRRQVGALIHKKTQERVQFDDLKAEVQDDIGAYIKSYRFGYNNSGYIFIIKVHDLNGGERFGTMFANANRPDLVGKYLSDSVTDAHGKFFRREFLKGLRDKGECYVEYWYKKFESPKPEPKLTFFKHYPAAGLIVAAGSYLPENEKLIALRRGELISKLQHNLWSMLIALAVISLTMLLLARWWTRKSEHEIDRFRDFFSRAAIRGEKIEEDDFSFPEMRTLARDANLMLAERDKLDEKLKEREELFRTLTETSPAGILIHQGEFLIYANPAASVISGYSNEELVGMPFWQLVHPKMRQLVKERGLARQRGVASLPLSYQFKIICKDKKEKWLIFSAAPISYHGKPAALGNIVDITEKIEAEKALAVEQSKSEKELERVRKIEAVGLLAGGIAHDFNNLLTAIYGNISLALMQLQQPQPDLEKTGKNLEAAERSSARARDLTRQLLTFAKGGTPVKELVDITLMIRETAEFSLSGSNVRLEFDFSPDLWSL